MVPDRSEYEYHFLRYRRRAYNDNCDEFIAELKDGLVVWRDWDEIGVGKCNFVPEVRYTVTESDKLPDSVYNIICIALGDTSPIIGGGITSF